LTESLIADTLRKLCLCKTWRNMADWRRRRMHY